MKKLFLLLALFFTVMVSYSATATEKLKTHEEIISTHDIGIDAIFVQNQTVATNGGTFENREGFYLRNFEGGRYHSSSTFSRYSSFIETNTRANGDTYTNKIQARYSFNIQNWQSDTSRMLLRPARSGGEIIQGNYYKAKANYRPAKANNYFNSKGNTCVIDAVFMDRTFSCNRHTSDFNKTISIT